MINIKSFWLSVIYYFCHIRLFLVNYAANVIFKFNTLRPASGQTESLQLAREVTPRSSRLFESKIHCGKSTIFVNLKKYILFKFSRLCVGTKYSSLSRRRSNKLFTTHSCFIVPAALTPPSVQFATESTYTSGPRWTLLYRSLAVQY